MITYIWQWIRGGPIFINIHWINLCMRKAFSWIKQLGITTNTTWLKILQEHAALQIMKYLYILVFMEGFSLLAAIKIILNLIWMKIGGLYSDTVHQWMFIKMMGSIFNPLFQNKKLVVAKQSFRWPTIWLWCDQNNWSYGLRAWTFGWKETYHCCIWSKQGKEWVGWWQAVFFSLYMW